MTETAIAERKSKFPKPTIERCLIALAYWNGNTGKAVQMLAEDGIEVHHSTLSTWKNRAYVEDYERIRNEVLPRIRSAAAEQHTQLAERYMEIEVEMIEQLKGQFHQIEPRDMPGAVRNVATSAGIHAHKAKDLLDGAETIKATRDFVGMLREFKQLTGVEFRLPDPKPVEALEPEVTPETHDVS